MEAMTTLLTNPPHFPIPSKDFLSQSYTHPALPSTRKRKPIATYQSPISGVVDVGLLVRNTALEIEAAAAAAASRSIAVSAAASSSVAAIAAKSSVTDIIPNTTDTIPEPHQHATRIIPIPYRPMTIPRPPRPLYHPLSRPSTSKPTLKSSASSASVTSHLAVPSMELGRRSSSRTRRPAPKMRETEGLASITKASQEKTSSPRRRRGAAAGKRKRGPAQQEADGDGAYPASKRSRKQREKVDMEIDGDTMPPPTTNETTPPSGYSTRAKRPRKPVRAESSTSDGTGSVARTTPVNGHVEEFWVPTKAT
ncbi:hypothetical protein JB92DRAFT_2968903 [Gautieria morchelliformis]|nr:hypothetical protein JB92DRAFT_2968903 [Gautieria morchelliformis]